MRLSGLLLITLLAPLAADAQELCVAPAHLICDYEVPEKLDKQVDSKLQRALSAYGIGSEIGMSRFAMVPQVAINDEQTTTTIPAVCNISFDLVMSLTDVETGRVFATYSLPGKGSGSNKSNSIAKGVSALRLNTPEFERFCVEAKQKIVAYYVSNMDGLIAKANAAAKSREFDKALYILSEIPIEVPGYDSKVATAICNYYTSQLNLEGEGVLARAKAAWAQSPDEHGASKVADILEEMPVGCSSTAAANALMAEVKKKVTALQERELKFRETQAARSYSLEKQRQANIHSERMQTIYSARQVAVAYAKRAPRTVVRVVRVW